MALLIQITLPNYTGAENGLFMFRLRHGITAGIAPNISAP